MVARDLQIGSPVYRVCVDGIEIAHVRLIEQSEDGERSFALKPGWLRRCHASEDATELRTNDCPGQTWYVNLGDAELAQLMLRSEHVERLRGNMRRSLNAYAEAVEKYAFAEPSKPSELS